MLLRLFTFMFEIRMRSVLKKCNQNIGKCFIVADGLNQAAYMKRIWDAINDMPGISGGILWCWADYYHRKYFIKYNDFGPYGVVTVDRKPKKSFETLKEMFKKTM